MGWLPVCRPSDLGNCAMKTLRPLLYLLIGLLLGVNWVFSYAATVPYKFNGLNVTREGGATYLRGTSPSEVAAAGVTVTNGAIQAAGSANWYAGTGALLQSGGVTFNAVVPLAASAASVAVTAVRANPTGLVVGAVASYLLDKGLQYVDGQWKRSGGVAYEGDATAGCVGITQHLTASSPSEMCQNALAFVQSVGNNGCSIPTQPGNMVLAVVTSHNCAIDGVNDGGSGWRWAWEFQPGNGAPVAATESDWAAARAGIWPDAAMLDLVKKGVPLPTDNPVFSPAYKDVPLSDPVVDPVTGKRTQDKARVTPNPSAPDTADVQVMKQEVDAQGNPVVDPVTGGPAAPTEENDLCKKHPEASACQRLDAVDDVQIPQQDNPFSLNPISGFGADNASCPASVHLFNKGGQSIDWSWSQFCTFSQGMRPLVIGFAWLAAIAMVVAVGRRTA